MYDGTLDDECPVHGSAVSFKIGDYLHIFEKFDANWWVQYSVYSAVQCSTVCVQVGGQEGEGELRHRLHPLPGPAGAAHPAEGARGQTGPVSQWL